MPKITEVYVFIATDKDSDDEGVVAMRVGDQWMPLVAADKARLESLKPIAQQIATVTKKDVVLAKFSVRENIENITPHPFSAG